MSILRLFLFVVMLVTTLGVDCVIAQQLPNSASSISETYNEWTVSCRLVDGHKQCLLTHAQASNQTGQRVFGIELRVPKDGKTEGTILMPFGLKIDSGATLKLDDKDLGQGRRFDLCATRVPGAGVAPDGGH